MDKLRLTWYFFLFFDCAPAKQLLELKFHSDKMVILLNLEVIILESWHKNYRLVITYFYNLSQ